MEFFRRAIGRPSRLGIFPGSFNPPTIAHVTLAQAALRHVDEVVFVLPRVFPHKNYEGASFDERAAMLCEAAAAEPRFSVASSSGGLFLEIARECRDSYGSSTALSFLCGRDAAERIVGWDYGRPGAAAEMFREFDLLVAARDGAYDAPAEHAAAVRTLDAAGCDAVSATGVRDRIARGEAWEHLVPEPIRKQVRRIYSRAGPL
jgi:nicotinate (nicotinamide) nucleotide adenylyltransferase